jgi:hypothetical protein
LLPPPAGLRITTLFFIIISQRCGHRSRGEICRLVAAE